SDARLSTNVALLNANNIFLGNDSFHLNSTALTVQDATTPLGADLFSVTDNSGATKYFEVNATALKFNGNNVCTTAGNCTGVGGGVTTSGGTTGKIAKFTGSQAIGDSILSESGTTLTASGNVNITTGNTYQINGVQISSAALSNDSNLAKLNANQTFTGNNTFSSASNSFTGDGSGLTNLNAGNISSGTLNDARLSANVPLKNANNTFTGYNTLQNVANSTTAFQIQNALGTSNLFIADTTNTRIGIGKAPTLGTLDVNGAIYQSGNQVCDTSGNCVGTGGSGAVGGSGTAGTLAVFTGSGFTIGNSVLSQSGGNLLASGNISIAAGSQYQV